MSLFKSTKVIGLDIGTSFIKLAEVDVSRKGASLVSFGIIPTPQAAISSRGEITDTAAVAAAVKELVRQVKTKRKHAATGMWGASVMVKKITGPKMSAQDLESNLKFEAEQYIPFDINEINLDFAILNSKKNSAETMDYLLIAAQREFLFKLAEVVEMADLQCSIIDVAGFSLANCFQFNYGEAQSEAVALLNIGAGVTNFVVVDHGDVIFCRDIPVGGMNFTNELHKQLGVSLVEAEALKISASTGQKAPQEATEVIRQVMESTVEEMQRGFDFFATTAADTQLSKILVSGGASQTPGLKEHLAQIAGVQVAQFNPFTTVSYNPKIMSPDYIQQITPYAAVSIGLALRKADDR